MSIISGGQRKMRVEINETLIDLADLMNACDTTRTIDINRQLFLQTLWPFHNYEHKNCVLFIILNQVICCAHPLLSISLAMSKLNVLHVLL